MNQLLRFVKATLIGGVIFLIPMFLIIYIGVKVLAVAGKVVKPLVDELGIDTVAGIAVLTLAEIAAVVLTAFVFGLIAKTRPAQRALEWVQSTIIGSLPQFSILEGVVKSFDSEGAETVPVLLVPTDAGWTLALQIAPPEGDWYPVFLPGSPQWTSGSVAYAHADDVRPAGINLAKAMTILRKRGGGSSELIAHLAAMKAKGEI
jgi:uncharacterized membrane protein